MLQFQLNGLKKNAIPLPVISKNNNQSRENVKILLCLCLSGKTINNLTNNWCKVVVNKMPAAGNQSFEKPVISNKVSQIQKGNKATPS